VSGTGDMGMDAATRIRGSSGSAWMRRLGPFLGLLVVIAVFVAVPPHKGVSLLDVRTVLVHGVIVAIVGIGMTVVVISGGIDLSVGSGLALCGVTAAMASARGVPMVGVVLTAIGTGVLCGVYNGLLVTGLRLPAFLATLGTLGFFRGIAKWLAGSGVVSAPDHGLNAMMQPIPASPAWLVAPGVWLMAALALGAAGILRLTTFGRHMIAIGSNETAARHAGLRIGRCKVYVYAMCGGFVGVAGLLQFGRLTVGDPTGAVGYELDAVAAVVIGGGSLAGGSGSILGTVIGALMMAYLRNRCAALMWPQFVQEIIVGHIIIFAVAMDRWRRRGE